MVLRQPLNIEGERVDNHTLPMRVPHTRESKHYGKPCEYKVPLPLARVEDSQGLEWSRVLRGEPWGPCVRGGHPLYKEEGGGKLAPLSCKEGEEENRFACMWEGG